MTIYYLIKDNALVANMETGVGDITALPLLVDGAMSLMNEQHANNMMENLGLSASEALAALGISDHRDATYKAVVIGPDISGGFPWPVYKLLAIDYAPETLLSKMKDWVVKVLKIEVMAQVEIPDGFALYEVDADEEALLSLHATLWEMPPVESLGLLAVVDMFGETFYPSLVRTVTEMTIAEALARRDRIAAYLESIGYTDTTALRESTNEHDQMAGIVTALGYTINQLWGAMVDV